MDATESAQNHAVRRCSWPTLSPSKSRSRTAASIPLPHYFGCPIPVTSSVTRKFASGQRFAKRRFRAIDGSSAARAARQVLLRIVATQEAVQQHRIDVDEQPPPPQEDDAAGENNDNNAAVPPAPEESEEEAIGEWVGEGGASRFVREPRRANDRAVTWKELDADGNEVGRYTQLDARVDTRWVWWLGALYKRLMSIGGETQYVAMCALSIAGAYNLDFTVPMWVRQRVWL